MTRLEKKEADLDRDLGLWMEWFQDFRGAMLEALEENIDVRVIVRQFKRKMIRRGNYNRWFNRTRMGHYEQVALDMDR